MIHTIKLYGKRSCSLLLALLMLFPLLAAFAFPSGAASIFESAETSWVTTTDARIAANTPNTVNISAHGCDYGTSKDNLDQHISDGAASGIYIFYFVFSEYGRTLKPNTTYYWRIWITVDGVKHYTDIYSFKTKDPQSVQPAMWFMKNMYFTQLPNGAYSHKGTLNFDVVGYNGNHDIFAPFDCKVLHIYSAYESGNSVFVQSINPVLYADGTIDYMTMVFAHDNDVSNLSVGQVIKQGTVFYQTGTYGNADGRHSHVTCIKGKYKGDMWTVNSYGYCCSPNAISPEKALFLSPDTNVITSMGLSFKTYFASATVTFDPNGGTVDITSKDFTVGKSYGSLSIPSREGYEFIGWAKDDGTIVDVTDIVNNSHHLTAQWQPTLITVTYDANGGENAPAPQQHLYGVPFIVTSDIPTRAGYRFVGWTVFKHFTQPVCYPGDSYNADSTRTLYAVWEKLPEGSATLTVNDRTVAPGSTVTLDVLLQENPGIAFLSVTLNYDTSVLTLQSVSNGTIISDMNEGLNLVWSADSNATGTGVLCQVTFLVKEDAQDGDYTVSVDVREAYDENTNDVSFSVSGGTVTVLSTVYGDANGDGVVNGKDVVLLRKYIANYNYDTGASSVVVSAGADANGDGFVNGKDVVLMRKYMANYNYDTDSSTVILGPKA